MNRRCVRAALGSLLLGLGAVLPGACTGPTPQPSDVDPGTQVYCLRGLWDVFSTGLDELARKIRAEGIPAVSLSGTAWPDVVDHITKSPASAAADQQLVLAGHSFGADDAVNAARLLGRRDIRVPLLVLIDATAPSPIPDNVDRCVHLYLPNTLGDLAPRAFSGNPVVPAEGNTRTEIINRPLRPEDVGDATHFNLEGNPFVQNAVIAEILRLYRGAGETP